MSKKYPSKPRTLNNTTTNNPQNLAQLNIQNNNNIFMENELNAIAKLQDKTLQDRAMALLEENNKHIRNINTEIVAMEKQEQQNRYRGTRWFYILQLIGTLTSSLVILASMSLFFYLAITLEDSDKWYSIVGAIPAILTALIKALNIKRAK